MFFRKKSKQPEVQEIKKPSFKKRLIKFIFNLFFLMTAVVVVFVALYVLTVFLQMPSLDTVLNETRQPTVTFLDKDGNEIRSTNKIMGNPVSATSLPPYVWQAIVAIEDKRFFEHGPIDPQGLIRASFTNLTQGRIAAGGSTITQQTAKNIFLSREKKISRKIQELILAYWLEDKFSKYQILDLYMNRVSLVGGLRGIDAAARILFQKSARELSIAEAAQIAAMLKAPTTYSPILNPDKNIARARLVLQEMVRQEYISLNDARIAARELAPAKPLKETNQYRYWTDFVNDEAISAIGNVPIDIKVYTTLDTNMQNKVADIVAEKATDYQGAVVAMSKDGALRVMVGGTDYQTSQFNRVTAPRQPGSTFKPIVYLVALENGYTPTDIVNDSKFSIGDYSPENYNERYYGEISLATAFSKSVNSVPLQLTEEFGIETVLDMTARLGGGGNLRREYSTILGASEISLLGLTTMYNVIWNNGESVRPYSITKITNLRNEVLFSRNPSEPLQILNQTTVDYIQDMLNDAITSGTGKRANTPGVIGGKTGTSNGNRDAWFIGATDDLTMGVWVGRDDFTPMDSNIVGGTLPAEIFKLSIE